ncbi:hypothetical protein CTheo_6573 [Ceratobasidium theobromae]|uniref:NACHT domain-containing protein n=1 Tax=Ceratobasidium theobromae TaxID=1582974 RepID=A0A5N5QEV6_9AGAM|nr:hypothetical protein CTheo_6573 [Ceratobasidium theobromae]
MSSPPASPTPKRGVRNYIRNKYVEFIRSRSRSPSISAGTSTLGPNPPPQTHAKFQSTGNALAPPTIEEAAALRHSYSAPFLPLAPDPPTRSDTHSGNATWNGLRRSLEAFHEGARMFPPLQSAVGAFISCIDILEATAKNRQEYEDIASELKTLSQSLIRHMKESNSARISDCVANVALSIEQQAKLINNKQERGTGRRVLDASGDEEEIIRYYRRIEGLFRQLQTDANLSTWSIANEHLVNTRLEGLTPAKLATYDSILSTEINRRTCTDGTRTAVLSAMDEWSHDSNAPDLYWMDGMAGTGKTTIACSFSKMLEGRKQLAASFFCTRNSPECRQVGRIIPTIAYQLARYSIPFQGALCEVLGNEPDIGTKNVAKQVERLLKEPLDKVKKAIPENLVVVIDALDECEDRHGVRLVLDLLFKFVPTLPLKFFVTSRPEPIIYTKMITQSPTSRAVLHLHEIEKSLVKADIELYLREELSFMSLTNEKIEQLAERSGNLFIYAATLVRFIQPTTYSADPQERLTMVLDMTPQFTDQYAEVDSLYTVVLESALGEKRLTSREVEDMRLMLRMVLCVQEPVSIDTLATLAGIDTPRRALSALQPLRSVIHFLEDSRIVSTLHASFPDFMFNQARSGVYFCDRAEHNQLISHRCFETMKSQLRFNICDLESSSIPDAGVINLESRTKKAISPALWYSCIYWGEHLRLADTPELYTMLEDFFSTRLLFWMEVLNLKKSIGLGSQVLMKAGAASPDIIRFCDDAHSFVTSYAANPVSQSTPHIYISSISLCPRSSFVFKRYSGRTRGMISLQGSGIDRREMAALATWTFDSSVRSLAYSPDGNRVAFGCDDGSMGVRNAYDGSAIVDTFKGHTKHIMSIAFSPDGGRLITSSDDETMHLWNAEDGAPISCSFNGHSSRIKSVKFSRDGSRIVSSSADCTIRVWRATDGTAVGDAFRGHGRPILSISLSPDGTCVASGSMDATVRVWNVGDGTLVTSPFNGHSGSVYSVDYSPDGRLIASGSADKTIRLWNAQAGTPISHPLQGHTSTVQSVAFSPDSKRLVSGSHDSTIRVWSMENFTLVAGPFEGHTDIVHSVAFSPDGMRVVSTSGDRTIRVWNTREGIPVAPQFEGHTTLVRSVAFSPDGSRVVSGSYDHVVCLWDAHDGSPATAPFRGHTEQIWSVAFSSDGMRIVSASADHTIRVWNTQDGTLACSPLSGHTSEVYSVAVSPDGTHIASGSSDRTVRIWNLHTGKLVAGPFKGHTKLVMSVAFSPDGTTVASGSHDLTIRLWDSVKGTLKADPFRGHTNAIVCIAFSPDGLYVASGSSDHTIRVWKAANGDLAAGPLIGHTKLVQYVAFSPNGRFLASASSDQTIRLWSSLDGTPISSPLCGHTRWVTSIAFAPDGMRLVSCSGDRTIRMWDISNQALGLAPGSRSPGHSSSPLAVNQALPTALNNWAVRDDGWVISGDGHFLLWLPVEIRLSLLTPRCTFIISRSGTTRIDMAGVLLGDRWHECYVSE